MLKGIDESQFSYLTSFLSNGIKKGSLTLRPATIVSMGSRQLNMAPKISIFPSFGSTGSIDSRRPANRDQQNEKINDERFQPHIKEDPDTENSQFFFLIQSTNNFQVFHCILNLHKGNAKKKKKKSQLPRKHLPNLRAAYNRKEMGVTKRTDTR